MVILFIVSRPFYCIMQHAEVVDGGVVKREAVHVSQAGAGADVFRNSEDINYIRCQSSSLGKGRERREGVWWVSGSACVWVGVGSM